jgi:GT2 family glycosyltransferase
MSDSGVEISVIIPTVGRASRLRRSLQGFERLDPETPEFEVIVVLDGEDEATRELSGGHRPFPFRLVSQERAGPGPARNLGTGEARGDLIVLLNDDTRPDSKNLLAHASAQTQLGPCAAVGRVEWDPEREVTPYMAWLAPAGHQFNYSRLDPEKPVPWDACWGTNLAIPRKWLLDEPFDPLYPRAAVEDGEWGYRLTRSGRPLRFVPAAVCYHDHRYEGPADYRQRARAAGAASRYVVRRHPRLAWALIGRPKAATAARLLSLLWPGSWRRELMWDLDFRANYVFGILQPRLNERLR